MINAAARLVIDLLPRDHVTPTLLQLHLLPIEYRIRYKLSSGAPGDQRQSTTLAGEPIDDRCQRLFAGVTALRRPCEDLLIPATRQHTRQSGVLSLHVHGPQHLTISQQNSILALI